MATSTNQMWLSFFLATIVAIAQASNYNLITDQIHLLRPKSGSGGAYVGGISCLSWRLGIETNNIIGWTKIPDECTDYVGHYMIGSQYRLDSQLLPTKLCYSPRASTFPRTAETCGSLTQTRPHSPTYLFTPMKDLGNNNNN